ncbi:hypothetical protein BWO94_05400 [Staphylococcus aureus]|nr:hypothetical protein BRL61_10405 [Staphylococcus aureus]OOC92500.1 hypothetical protein BWO94_05400 [Staphylococcus aureus]
MAYRNWCSNFSVLGPTPQPALPVEFLFSKFSVLGPTPQLALPVEIVDPISLCWGPANLHIIVS